MNQLTNICPLLAIAAIGSSQGPAVCLEGAPRVVDVGRMRHNIHRRQPGEGDRPR